ncbi:hypothetical protein [Hyalangium versicolor]|uniref:hypothetical protein n=1 Tax=Hyalangium versicolor TaxID=2861190 RepID=UPI001CCC05AA|nr:hypothetical protein [Hyalangium versicolor]
MTRHGWKGFVVAGLLGLTGLAMGCSERGKAEVRESARQVGQEVGKATEDVKEAGKEAADGFREGWGGSGTDKNIGDGKIGDKPGVINDGEGPFEQHDQRGDHNILKDGEGPLEGHH